MKILEIFLVLIIYCVNNIILAEDPIITDIPGVGKVKGRELQTQWSKKTFYHYFDIKYGESPSGPLRFKPPVPAKPWSHIRNGMLPRKGCPSIQELDRISTQEHERDVEDCLFLTISTKSHTAESPVMVYFHGEFLYDGTSLEAAPDYIMERDIVLVSVRYRLAPFGFLSTMTNEIPGNAAVFDAILALEWIKNHISTFGGDPNRVTLFGQVGGAALANLLTMSPVVPNNLFHRIIYQSGSVQSPMFTTYNPLPYTRHIAKLAGCKDVNSTENMNLCLMQLNSTTLITSFHKHAVENSANGVGSYGGFQFVIGGPSGVLPEHPIKLIRAGKIKYYPTMGGVTKNAGTFLLKEIFEDYFNGTIPNSKFNGMQYIDFIIKHTNGGDPNEAWKKFTLDNFFTKSEINNGTFAAMLSGLIDMCGSITFKNPLLLALQANAKQMPNNTFLYSFDYEGAYSRYLTEDEYDHPKTPFDMGVSLTDDNIYLFPWPPIAADLNRRDTAMAKKMVILWQTFAATGRPKAAGISQWPPMTESTGPYLKINEISTVGKNFLDEYAITVREAREGYSLAVEDFWERSDESGNLDYDYYDDDDDY